jgi:ribose transport system ATP-binding protein
MTAAATSSGNAQDGTSALVVGGLSKSFAGTQALRDFDIDLHQGEVHALVGGNGSGKSTFIKILAGVYQADRGEATCAGATVDLSSQTPAGARAMGLRFVHQDLGIIPLLSVAENLAIGDHYPVGMGAKINWRQLRSRTRATLERFHLDVDPRTPAEYLSTPQRAMLAIARALQTIDESERGILVLDEPTASLPPDEATLLLTSIRRLAGNGHTVLLVTHRLDEVKRAADRVTGLRDGVRAGTIDTAQMTESDAVQLILGRRLENATAPRRQARAEAAPLLEVEDLCGGPLAGVSLSVRPGEVVGIAGLLGSGRTELLEMLFGVRPFESGRIVLDGKRIASLAPGRMRRLGMAFVPEDRQAEAVFPDQSVAQNVTAGGIGRYFSGGLIRDRRLMRDVRDDVRRFHVKTSSADAGIETLSGGNQQKVVLARWLRDKPRVILLDEPTQGIDVGAREEIFTLIGRATEEGAAVLLVSSEFEELTRLAHRVLVLAGGRITAELEANESAHDIFESVIEPARSRGKK